MRQLLISLTSFTQASRSGWDSKGKLTLLYEDEFSLFKLRPDCSCINPSKARRLVERYNELPDRYMQVIGRCRDPGSLDDLEELRRSRPIRQENKEQVKLERSLMRKEKAAEKEEKM